MSILSLAYSAPVRRSVTAKPLDFGLVETATAQFEAGAFLEVMQTVFLHLFPDGTAVDLAKEAFTFIQGSSRVSVRLEDNIVFVSVSLVRLPSGGAVAALRYLLSKVNGSGQLYQARLRGDEVHFEYRERLSALHPQKLMEVLRRMALDADRHDDWMISQFDAIALERGSIAPLDDDELARALQIWQAHWSDVEELLKEAQRKRSKFFLNETTAFALYRIRFAVPLGGSILPRLLESARTFNDADVDSTKRESALAKCIKDMKAVSADELRRSLGHADHAISPLCQGTVGQLTGMFGPCSYMDTIESYRTAGQALDAALPLICSYYYLLASFAWPSAIERSGSTGSRSAAGGWRGVSIEDELKRGLAMVSGQPWREVAHTLFTHARNLVEQLDGEDGDEGDDDEDDEGDEGDAEVGDAEAEGAA